MAFIFKISLNLGIKWLTIDECFDYKKTDAIELTYCTKNEVYY